MKRCVSAPIGRYLINPNIGFICTSLTEASNPADGGWLHLTTMNAASFVGTLDIGTTTNGDDFQSLLSYPLPSPTDISQGSIVDIPLTHSQFTILQSKRMKFQQNPPTSLKNGTRTPQAATTVPYVEQTLVANTDQRSFYNDAAVGQIDNITIAVTDQGQPAAAGVNVLVVKYNHVPSPNINPKIIDSDDTTQTMTLVDSSGNSIETTVPYSTGGQTLAAVVQTDANGNASVSVKSLDDGFGLLVFFPYGANDTQPQPTVEIGPQNYGYSCLRIWPDDNADMVAFAAAYNGAISQGADAIRYAAWQYVYDNILYLYDMLYPVMLRFLPLNDLNEI